MGEPLYLLPAADRLLRHGGGLGQRRRAARPPELRARADAGRARRRATRWPDPGRSWRTSAPDPRPLDPRRTRNSRGSRARRDVRPAAVSQVVRPRARRGRPPPERLRPDGRGRHAAVATRPRRDLPARRRGRTERPRPLRGEGLLRRAADDRRAAARLGEPTRRSTSTGSSACIPSLAPLASVLPRPLRRLRPRRRQPRRDALALRRAGLHGVGHAGREVDAGRLPLARARRHEDPEGLAAARGGPVARECRASSPARPARSR